MTTHEDILNALGDPTRRVIIERIRQRPRAVGQIAEGMNVSRPAVSQHLRVLERAGLVSCTREGTRRIYHIDHQGIEVLRRWVDGFWDQILARFKEAADRPEEGEHDDG